MVALTSPSRLSQLLLAATLVAAAAAVAVAVPDPNRRSSKNRLNSKLQKGFNKEVDKVDKTAAGLFGDGEHREGKCEFLLADTDI